MRDSNRYGYTPDELQRLFGRTSAYEGDAWMERGGNKAEAAQGRGNGRTHATVSSSTNRQASREEKALEKGAAALNSQCRTGAKVTGGNLYGSYVEYEFNGDHGFGRGRTGHVEVVNNRVVRIHG